MSRRSSSLQIRALLPFELTGGGSGVGFSVTEVATGFACPMTAGQCITVCNDGDHTFWFVVGNANVVATTSGTPVLPGTKEVFSIPLEDGNTYSYMSKITRAGTSTTGTVNFGFGT